jgi:hypothetical protein
VYVTWGPGPTWIPDGNVGDVVVAGSAVVEGGRVVVVVVFAVVEALEVTFGVVGLLGVVDEAVQAEATRATIATDQRRRQSRTSFRCFTQPPLALDLMVAMPQTTESEIGS